MDVEWTIIAKRSIQKQIDRLPQNVRLSLLTLLNEIRMNGPVRGGPNCSVLPNNRYHCHLKKGRPTHVAVWEVIDKERRLIEVIYAGTHERAPY